MTRITEPGCYDMPAEDYHADPCAEPSLSSSIAKKLIFNTPLHAWTDHPRLNPDFERDEDSKFDLGTAAHSLILGDPKHFEIIDADSFATKDAKFRRDSARAAGKIPMLSKNWDRVLEMAHAAELQLACHHEAADAFKDGKPEQTIIWREGPAWCRARLDWLSAKTGIFYDYKSTENANPDAWQRIIFNVGHDLQSAFYRRGIAAVLGIQDPVFRFVVQETNPPYGLVVVELDQEAIELADYRVHNAVRKWNWCMEQGKWPGYPSKIVTVGAPTWHAKNVLDREETEASLARARGHKDSIEALHDSFVRQSPI